MLYSIVIIVNIAMPIKIIRLKMVKNLCMLNSFSSYFLGSASSSVGSQSAQCQE